MDRIILHANKGKILTDGTIYGYEIAPADGVEASAFYEIDIEEYEAIMAAEAEASMEVNA